MTVYLSDELAEAAEPYRERLNFSRIFSDALQREIYMQQLKDRALEDDDQQAVVERLRMEKVAAHAADEEAGRQKAAQHVKQMSYLELESIALIDLKKAADRKPQMADAAEHSGGGKYNPLFGAKFRYARYLPFEIADEFISYYAPDEIVDVDAWAHGWLSYVQDWWASVKDQL